jgi:VanZ family protein
LIRALLWLPAGAQMALIFAASSVPGDQLPGNLWDKLAHLVVYAVLGLCFLFPLAGGRLSGVTASRAAGAVLLSLLYGVSDEIHQSFTPDRSPDAMDVVADTLGAALGAASGLAIARLAGRRRAGRPR